MREGGGTLAFLDNQRGFTLHRTGLVERTEDADTNRDVVEMGLGIPESRIGLIRGHGRNKEGIAHE